VGVSVDDLDAATAALSDPRIKAIQVPAHEGDTEVVEWISSARAAGKLVILREIFRQMGGSVHVTPDALERNMNRALEVPGKKVVLLGTTKRAHLQELVAIAERYWQ
jgi:hypothetical protein